MNEFLILFRESLESVLIVGLVYSRVERLQWPAGQRGVWLGLVTALGASLLLGTLLYQLRRQMPPGTEPFLEAGLMLLAAGFLLHMVVWMAGDTRAQRDIVARTEHQTGLGVIFLLVFFGVLREGFETVIFLAATAEQKGELSLLPALAGALVSIAIGLMLFRGGRRLPLRRFFDVSSVLLVVMAAGMASMGLHELMEGLYEVGMLQGAEPAKAWQLFSPGADGSYPLLHHKGAIGGVLRSLTGYSASPTWWELGLWAFTLVGGIWAWRARLAERAQRAPVPLRTHTEPATEV